MHFRDIGGEKHVVSLMKRYQFSPLYSINCESFCKWIRLKRKHRLPERGHCVEETSHEPDKKPFKQLWIYKRDTEYYRSGCRHEITHCLELRSAIKLNENDCASYLSLLPQSTNQCVNGDYRR